LGTFQQEKKAPLCLFLFSTQKIPGWANQAGKMNVSNHVSVFINNPEMGRKATGLFSHDVFSNPFNGIIKGGVSFSRVRRWWLCRSIPSLFCSFSLLL